MSRQWKYTLHVSSFYHDDSMSIQDKGKRMSKAIEKLPIDKIETMCGDYFEDLIEHFKDVSDVEEFDEIMEELYDMSDRYDIWIETKK